MKRTSIAFFIFIFFLSTRLFSMEKESLQPKVDPRIHTLCSTYLPGAEFDDLKLIKLRYAHLISPAHNHIITENDRKNDCLKILSDADCKTLKQELKERKYYHAIYSELFRVAAGATGIAGVALGFLLEWPGTMNAVEKTTLETTLGIFCVGLCIGTRYLYHMQTLWAKKESSLRRKRGVCTAVRRTLNTDGDGDMTIKCK